MRTLQAGDGQLPVASSTQPPSAAIQGPPAAGLPHPADHAADLSLARSAVETVVRVGLMLALAAWCFWIIRPFLFPLIWGVIIAVSIQPGYRRLSMLLGGRTGLAAIIAVAVILAILIGPLSMLTTSLVANMSDLAVRLLNGAIKIPPPPPAVIEWPFIGPKIEQIWSLGSAGLRSALEEAQPQLRLVGGWILGFVAELGLGLLHFVAAVIVAGILLAHSAQGHRLASDLATRLIGQRGPGLADLAEHTIRNVARGVIGTALVQSTLAGLGFVVAGVPWAAVLTLLCFLMCLVQIGPGLVLLGTIIYMFSYADPLTAGLFLVWCLIVGTVDNVLRPILIGRGSEVPLAVILLGVLGGLLAHGLIGLFVGPIVLALGHQLFRAWLSSPSVEGERIS